LEIFNIGMGVGRSTFQMIEEFEKACGKKITVRRRPRRSGDVPTIYCDPSKAEDELGWKAVKSHQEMCEDLWRFYQLNPNGYSN